MFSSFWQEAVANEIETKAANKSDFVFIILAGGEPHFLSCLIIVSVLMIQRYSTKNSVENRCDQLTEPCDEILKPWEIKKLMTAES